jgi:hypothetical protein
MFPRALSRKSFLKLTALTLGGVSLPLAFFRLPQRNNRTGDGLCLFRIRPLPGRNYSPSFIRLCQRARFRNLNHALSCVRTRDIEFEIYRVAQDENFVRPTGRVRLGRAKRPEGDKPRATFFET